MIQPEMKPIIDTVKMIKAGIILIRKPTAISVQLPDMMKTK